MVSDDSHRKPADASARELTVQLGEQLSRLVSHEIALAKAEMFASARQAVRGGGLLTGAGIAGHTAWLAMAAAAVAGIAVVFPVWEAALIVGGALALAAGVLAMLGRRRLRGTVPLRMTMESVRRELSGLAASGAAAGPASGNGRQR